MTGRQIGCYLSTMTPIHLIGTFLTNYILCYPINKAIFGKVIAAAGEAVPYTSSDFAYDSAGHGIEHPGHSAGITLEVGATVEGTAALAMQRSNVARVYGGYDIACVLRCFHRKLRY